MHLQELYAKILKKAVQGFVHKLPIPPPPYSQNHLPIESQIFLKSDLTIGKK